VRHALITASRAADQAMSGYGQPGSQSPVADVDPPAIGSALPEKPLSLGGP